MKGIWDTKKGVRNPLRSEVFHLVSGTSKKVSHVFHSGIWDTNKWFWV